jgi:hypothetical protein
MGCACKVNQRINEIQKHYGINNKKTVKTNISETISLWFKQSLIYVLCLPIMPLIILYLIWNSLYKHKPISIKKFLKLKK